MRNLSVKHLLAAVQGLMLAALLAIAATGILTKLDVMDSLRRVDEIAAQQVAAINRTETNLMELRLRLGRFNEYSEDGDTTRAQESLELARAALERAETRFSQFTSVEVPSTASASLQDEAARLAELVAAFRLNASSRHAQLSSHSAPASNPRLRAPSQNVSVAQRQHPTAEPEWEAF